MPFFLLILHLLATQFSSVCGVQAFPEEEFTAYSLPHNMNVGKFLGELTIYREIGKFLTDAREKLEADCTTVIWDYGFSTVLDQSKLCGPGRHLRQACIPVYTVLYDNRLNITGDIMKTLREGYRRRCGSYVIILKTATAVTDLLHQGDDYRLLNIRARFLIWYGINDKAFEADDIWKKVPNTILFHTKLGYRARRRTTFTIKGFKWPVIPNTPDPTKVVDFWSQGKYFGRSHEGWYRDKTTDLKNVTLRILAVEHPPGVIKYEKPDGQIEYAGSEVEIVKELSNIMHFQYEFLEVESETKWGGQVTANLTPHFYGAVARLIFGEADLAIGSFFVLKHYLDFLDMSIPLDVACTSFLTPNPSTRPRYLALILPFNYKLWALVLCICFAFAPLCLYALSKLPIHNTEYHAFTGRSQVVFTCFSIMSQVALHIWPRFWAVRMFIGWFWMFCLLITLAYKGAMVSFLTIPLFENPIDNIDDLVASGLKIGGWGTELHRLFTQYTTTNGHIGSKAVLRDRYEMIDDVNAAISWVAEGEFALYENIRFLKFIRQTRNLTRLGSPSTRLMKQCIVPVHIGIAYQKNSPIVPTINRHIRRFQESGLIRRWSQRLVTRTKQHYQTLAESDPGQDQDHHDSDEEDEEEENEEEAAAAASNNKQRKQRVLNMRDLQGCVYLILFGFFLSIVAFIGEQFVANSAAATAVAAQANVKGLTEEIKKLKEKATKHKEVLVAELGNKLNLNLTSSNLNTGDDDPTNESSGGCKRGIKLRFWKRSSDSNPKEYPFGTKQHFVANMLREYDTIIKLSEQKKKEAREKRMKKFSLKRIKTDGIRVRYSNNTEVHFTYLK